MMSCLSCLSGEPESLALIALVCRHARKSISSDSFETPHSMDGGWPVDRGKEAQMIHDAKVDVLAAAQPRPALYGETQMIFLND